MAWNRRKELMEEARRNWDENKDEVMRILKESAEGTYVRPEGVKEVSIPLEQHLYEIEHQHELGVHIDFRYPGGIEGLRKDVEKEKREKQSK